MEPEGLDRALGWYAAAAPPPVAGEVCASRDVFQARLDGLLRQLLRDGWQEDDAALLVAVLGEVGNNSFDHNLGQWRDVPGCWFGRGPEMDPALFWIMDRGVGILATLRRADPALRSAQKAVDAAFHRVLSGRAPERRGNGLKFVRSVVNGSAGRGLLCRSGDGLARFGGLLPRLDATEAALAAVETPGVGFVLGWRTPS